MIEETEMGRKVFAQMFGEKQFAEFLYVREDLNIEVGVDSNSRTGRPAVS